MSLSLLIDFRILAEFLRLSAEFVPIRTHPVSQSYVCVYSHETCMGCRQLLDTAQQYLVYAKCLLSSNFETNRLPQQQIHLPPIPCYSKPMGESSRLCEALEISLYFPSPADNVALRRASLVDFRVCLLLALF